MELSQGHLHPLRSDEGIENAHALRNPNCSNAMSLLFPISTEMTYVMLLKELSRGCKRGKVNRSCQFSHWHAGDILQRTPKHKFWIEIVGGSIATRS